MPLFDYECKNCGNIFEELTSASTPDEEISCPACGKQEAMRLLSAPSIGGGNSLTSGTSSCGASGFT